MLHSSRLPSPLPLLPPPVSASRQRQPSFSRVEAAQAAAVGAVPDCGDSPFMRAGQPCHTFLYAPAVRRRQGGGSRLAVARRCRGSC